MISSYEMSYFALLSVQKSIGLPDIHSGYGFAIGNTAAFDTANPLAVVSPGIYLHVSTTSKAKAHNTMHPGQLFFLKDKRSCPRWVSPLYVRWGGPVFDSVP